MPAQKNYAPRVFSIKDREWTRLLENLEKKDIYFTPEYAGIYENSYGKEVDEAFCGSVNLFFCGNESEYIIYPFIKREINKLDSFKGEKKLYDIISPYGYNGPIGNLENKELVGRFLEELNNFCKKEDIISEFTRFHPLIRNYESFGQADKRNSTVFIDLTKNPETILAEMDRKTRNLLRKAEKNNVQIEISEKKKDLEVFAELYLKTMVKATASPPYMLPLKFFEKTFESLGKNVSLFVARHNDEIVSAALIMHKYDYVHYHFSGSDPAHLNLNSNNLLIYKVALWGQENNYKYFHLGGGLGASETDPLYHFKAGFSKDRAVFYTRNKVHNEKVYNELREKKEAFNSTRGIETKKGYFPAYRA